MAYFVPPHRGRRRDFDFEAPPPVTIDVGREFSAMRRHLPTVLLVLVLGILFVLAELAPTVYTDYLWFRSLGQQAVFLVRLGARVVIFVAASFLFFGIFLLNVVIARRLAPRPTPDSLSGRAASFLSRPTLLLLVLAGLALAAFMGFMAQSRWDLLLRYLNRSDFGVSDPIFHQDIGFYVFTLPVWRFAQVWLASALVIIILAVATVYALSLGQFRFTAPVKAHLSLLGALLLFLFAWNYQLDTYGLVYSTRGVVYGASYTDVTAQRTAYTVLTILSGLVGALLLANVVLRALRLIGAGVGLWILAAIMLGELYPTAVQNFDVRPNEFVREKPYIEYNIAFTRQAFGLADVMEVNHPGEDAPTAADLARNADTIANIRLWDYRPLLDTYDQLQSIRPYYDFRDVDIDRYTIEGRYRQVMLSARELTVDRLPEKAQTWVNKRLVYTHGYGLTMSPVNEITPDGSPHLLIKNIPPVGEIPIVQPAIYFGEKLSDYIIVRTTTPEFDYPVGDQNAMTRYEGRDGVAIGSLFHRLLFAIRFGDMNILLTDAITAESRIIWNRNISERVQLLAPFLIYDRDPYIVIADGHLYWIQDAYTITDRYPYSEPYAGRFNYIRNSVKVVIDAYNGTTTFYIVDASDPLIRAYRGIYPTLFQPLEAMPASLRLHLRYPEDLFRVQADVFRIYHMQDPQVFYNKEDVWAIPKEIYSDKEQDIEPYYAIMRLPGETREEFILLMPFTPRNKQNMVAWLAAKCDGEDYGRRILFQIPKDRLIYGPMQVEARVSQDTVISAQITLWNQRGSKVIRGNMLVIPIEKSFLYVEPLYLLAETGQIPQLKRVIVATANNVAMDETLPLALGKLYSGLALPGGGPPSTSTGEPRATTTGQTVPGEIAQLVKSANDHYAKAQDALRAGDWARYGDELRLLEADLKRLSELTGTR